MRKRKSVRGLVLAAINVVVILAAALIVRSFAAGHFVPSSSLVVLPEESQFTLASLDDRTPFPFRRSSSGPLASPASAKGRVASTEVVPAPANGPQDPLPSAVLEFDEQWYAEPLAGFVPPATASESFPLKASVSGYGSALSTASSGHRSGLSTGYAGMGGGFSGAGGASSPMSSQSDPVSSTGPRSSSPGPTASAAGSPLLPPQAQGNPQGNPLLGGNGLGGPPSFVLNLSSSNLGSGGAIASGLVLPTGAGSTAGVTQLQTPVSVPEPATVFLLGCGLTLAAYRNRRRLSLRP